MIRVFVFLLTIIITSSAYSQDFTINTSYWFSKIKAVCADGSCDVYVNGKFKDKYDYQLDGSVAYTNISGMNIKYNIDTKELKY